MIGKPIPGEQAAEDSVNVLPAILVDSVRAPIRSSNVLHSPNRNFAIRQGRWKYIEGEPSLALRRVSRRDELKPQLDDLTEDPGEQNNLLSDHPEIASRLADLLNELRTRGRSR